MADILETAKKLEGDLMMARLAADSKPSGRGNDASLKAKKDLLNYLNKMINDKKTPENVRVKLQEMKKNNDLFS